MELLLKQHQLNNMYVVTKQWLSGKASTTENK